MIELWMCFALHMEVLSLQVLLTRILHSNYFYKAVLNLFEYHRLSPELRICDGKSEDIFSAQRGTFTSDTLDENTSFQLFLQGSAQPFFSIIGCH